MLPARQCGVDVFSLPVARRHRHTSSLRAPDITCAVADITQFWSAFAVTAAARSHSPTAGRSFWSSKNFRRSGVLFGRTGEFANETLRRGVAGTETGRHRLLLMNALTALSRDLRDIRVLR
jgi:hypothetical protein